MRMPAYLKKGDSVALVATANKVKQKDLDFALELLRSWQLKPVVGKSVGLQYHQLAGTDEERIEDFQKQLDNPDVKAIWCARGGYGSVRILDRLDFSKFKNNPKWIVGYSDVSAFHAHVNMMNIASLHGEMSALIRNKSAETKESLRAAFFGRSFAYAWKKNTLNRYGIAEGELIGGNLSVLYSLCGSRSIPDLKGKILFLEDVGEYLYHIDRMMQNLKRNGWFEKIKGLVVGGMTDMDDNEIPFGKSAREIVREAVHTYDFPVGFGFPAGHVKDNRALVFGGKMSLTVDEQQSRLVSS